MRVRRYMMGKGAEISRWCRDNLGSRAPGELIDPDGEGVYLLASVDSWTLQDAAHRVGATDHRSHPLWREIGREYVYMRQRGDEWFRVPWRAREAFKFPRWAPALYCYVTPPAEV